MSVRSIPLNFRNPFLSSGYLPMREERRWRLPKGVPNVEARDRAREMRKQAQFDRINFKWSDFGKDFENADNETKAKLYHILKSISKMSKDKKTKSKTKKIKI